MVDTEFQACNCKLLTLLFLNPFYLETHRISFLIFHIPEYPECPSARTVAVGLVFSTGHDLLKCFFFLLFLYRQIPTRGKTTCFWFRHICHVIPLQCTQEPLAGGFKLAPSRLALHVLFLTHKKTSIFKRQRKLLEPLGRRDPRGWGGGGERGISHVLCKGESPRT